MANDRNLSRQSQTPSIRTFQVDPSGLGAVAESVNLFRGAVSLPLTLTSISSLSGLEAAATIVYSSVNPGAIDTWNLEAPTGPVGLGWSMGYEFIAVDIKTSAAPNDDEYFLVADGSSRRLFKTLETVDYWEFELERYEFWQIRYYVVQQQWVIVKEDGNHYTYGGEVADQSVSPVQYGVKWGGSDGSWVAPGVQSTGQTIYPVAWNLISITTPWDDYIAFSYENDIDMLGTSSGKGYTRSSRLKQVLAPFNRTLTYHYTEKKHNQQIREYQIPHYDIGSPELHAYQDRYETQYLDRIELRNAPCAASSPSELLLTVKFGYDIINMSIQSQGNPDFYKRYLTRVSMITREGLELPNFAFEYYNSTKTDLSSQFNRGALKGITYPQGGRVNYDYLPTQLEGTKLDLDFQPKGIPRVWFGSDYAVITDYNGAEQGLVVNIHQWNGEWIESSTSYTFAEKIDLSTLKVSLQQEFFALSFVTDETNPKFYIALYHKQYGRYGQWYSEQDFYAFNISNGSQAILETGSKFAVAVISGGNFFCKVWEPRSKTWVDRSQILNLSPSADFALAATEDHFSLASYQSNSKRVSLNSFYLENTSRAFKPINLMISTLNNVQWDEDSTPARFWSLGSDYLVMTYVTGGTEQRIDYKVQIQQWGNTFDARLVLDKSYSVEAETKLPFAQSVASGAVVGNVGNLFRFNGVRWIEGSLPFSSEQQESPKFVYGSDAAVVSSTLGSAIALYDPYRSQWSVVKQTSGSGAGIVPTISGDFISKDKELFYRDSNNQLQLVDNLDQNMVAQSLSNRAPKFVCYQDGSFNTHVIPLANGLADTTAATSLLNQKIYVEGEQTSGTMLVGPSALLTYEGQVFDRASKLTLRQYANKKTEGSLTFYPIVSLSIDDGLVDTWGSSTNANTRYYYDSNTVTVTPDGNIPGYAAVTAVYGSEDQQPSNGMYPSPENTPYGRSEYRYLNDRSAFETGLVPFSEILNEDNFYYSYLNGMLYDQTDYDSQGEVVERLTNLYSVFTEYQPLDSVDSLPLIGGYVRSKQVDTSQYAKVIDISTTSTLLEGAVLEQNDTILELLRTAFGKHDVDIETAVLVSMPQAARWRLYLDPTQHAYLPVSLAGGQLQASVAVTRSVSYEYLPNTGLLFSDSTGDYNSDGKHEINRREIYYAWQVGSYVWMRENHSLSAISVSIKFNQTEGQESPGLATELSLTTYKDWGASVLAPCRTYSALDINAYQPENPIPVDFNDWTNQAELQVNWRRMGEVTARDGNGGVLEAYDVDQKYSSNILNSTRSQRIAEFTNSRISEVTYLGFESYESDAGWSMTGGETIEANIILGDAYTGFQSLLFSPSENTSLQKNFSIKTGNTTYIFSCWVKTPSDFNSDEGLASWVLQDESGTILETFDIVGTQGDWQYRNYVINIDGAGDYQTVTLLGRNQKNNASSTLLFDNLMFAPLQSEAIATVFHPLYGDATAGIGISGQVDRSFYDSYRREAGSVNANNAVNMVSAVFLARQASGNANSISLQDAPNAILNINPSTGGSLADFVNGIQWKDDWSTESFDDWQVSDDFLTHTKAQESTISYIESENANDYGVRVSLRLPYDNQGARVQPSQPLGLSIGSDLNATWIPGAGWEISLGSETITVGNGTLETDVIATDWVLIAAVDPVSDKTSVFFYVDGEQLFSRIDTQTINGSAALHVIDENISFSDFATFIGPRMSVSYLDGTGKERQKQGFFGTGSNVAETVFDPIGRDAIAARETKIEGANLVYLANYVESFDPVSGVMTGVVADDNPADQGYPYVRSSYLPTAQSLVYQKGQAGIDFAIINDASGNNLNTHITSIGYGTNIEGQFGGDSWPSNQYFVTKIVDPNGDIAYTLKTKTDKELAKMKGPLDASGDSWQVSQYFYDQAGRLIKVMPPKGVEAMKNGDANADRWAKIYTFNFIGDAISQSDPNAGTTEYVFDQAGRLRFMMDAEGANNAASFNTIIYTKYDALGRVREEGFFEALWNRETLQEKSLTQPNWPNSEQTHHVTNLNVYDGDGEDTRLYGQLVRSSNYHTDGSLTSEEAYHYDILRNVVNKSISAPGYDDDQREIAYHYDNLNNLIAMDYPDDAMVRTIKNRFDMLGQVFEIGTDDDNQEFGTYLYNAAGQLKSARTPIGNSTLLQRESHYNSPGWPISTTHTLDQNQVVFQQLMDYTENGFNNAGYFDGKIARILTTNNGVEYADEYQYDSLSRLQVDQNTVNSEMSLGVNSPVEYNQNSDIQTFTPSDKNLQYHYAPKTDQVMSVTDQSNEVDSYTYDLKGAVRSAIGLDLDELVYSPVLGKAISITMGANPPSGLPNSQVQFQYDSNGERLTKVVMDSSNQEISSKLYIRDAGELSIYEQSRTTDNTETRQSQYVYGPDGLVGALVGGSKYTVVRDHLGSVRCVIDQTGTVVATYDYTAFGVTVAREGSQDPDIIYYRFGGQEFDRETNLYNYKARFYDPNLGRFYSVDPAEQSTSPYLFVKNNPINLVDPDGEEALTAFLIAVIVSAIVGAVAGAITYAATYQGNFNVGKFFAYAAVGLVAGAAGGAAGYGAGVLATAGLAAAGVATSTTVASGVVVGATTGVVDGVVASSVNQIGVNLIEQRPIGEGLGLAIGMGAGIGLVAGGLAGGITGKLHTPTSRALKNPDRVLAGNRTSTGRFMNAHNIPDTPQNRFYSHQMGNVQAHLQGDEVLAIRGHGGRTRNTINFVGSGRVQAEDIATALGGDNFGGKGVYLGVCYAGQSGVARKIANGLDVPVLNTSYVHVVRGNGSTYSKFKMAGNGRVTNSINGLKIKSPFRTYYPSKVKTGWVALFGY
jgi:RHS repeat-associated protein